MTYRSNIFLCKLFRVMPTLNSLLPLGLAVLNLYNGELSLGLIAISPALSATTIALILFFNRVNKHFIEVEIGNDCIYNPDDSIKINWMEISSINIRWFGLYHVKLRDDHHLFPPHDHAFHFLGHKIFTDEFDDLIIKKKKELNI